MTPLNRHYFLAFDIGATSGRSILAILQDGKLELKELTRFPNRIIRIHNKYYWNIYSLFEELKKGIRAALSQGIPVESAGIDTWGVDFVYIAEDGTFTGLPRAYRDPYTDNIPEDYFTAVFPEKEVYGLTGIQIMNINSLFQLYAAKKENSQALLNAKKLLFIPDALSYLLTGKKICEYTIASTSQLLNPRTKQFETKLLEKAGIPGDILLPEITPPGSIIGNLSESIREECPAGEIPVIAVAGHDTASAVAAVPAENERFAYLSSGTWSLMGIEVKNPIINEQTARMNFTNEGGVDGTTRLLKNITGMWLLEQCRKEWELQGTAYTYAEIVDLSATVDGFQSLIDPENAVFSNPPSMTEAIAGYCKASGQKIPETHAGFIRCIFDSLALKYKQVLNDLRELSPFEIEKLHIIGGGSQNKLLNRLTANATGIPVIAGPSEATAIGNALLQAKGLGIVESLPEMRSIVRKSVTLETFYPQETALWEEAYHKFLSIITIK